MPLFNTSVYHSPVSRIFTFWPGNERDAPFLVPGILCVQPASRNLYPLGLFLIYLKKGMNWKYYPGILILVLGAGLLSLRIVSVESYAFVFEGINFFLGKGEYIGTISEALPLFLDAQGNLYLSPVLAAFGFCFLQLWQLFFCSVLSGKEKIQSQKGYFSSYGQSFSHIWLFLKGVFHICLQ